MHTDHSTQPDITPSLGPTARAQLRAELWEDMERYEKAGHPITRLPYGVRQDDPALAEYDFAIDGEKTAQLQAENAEYVNFAQAAAMMGITSSKLRWAYRKARHINGHRLPVIDDKHKNLFLRTTIEKWVAKHGRVS